MNAHSHVRTPPASSSLTRGELLALTVPGALLLWLVVTRTLASYVGTVDPETALFLQPSEPNALVVHAEAELLRLLGVSTSAGPVDSEPPDVVDGEGVFDNRLGSISRLAKQALTYGFKANKSGSISEEQPVRGPALTDTQLEPIRQFVIRSLQSRPLNADAMSLIARLADARGQTGQTAQFMETALRLSVRESYAAYWLFEKRLNDGDVAGALKYADILLRTRATSMPFVAPKLAKLAQSSENRAHLTALLATDPPWRKTFLVRLMALITDARTPLFQYLELKNAGAPPTTAELAIYLNFLAGKKFHDLAYYTWLQFQPPEMLGKLRPVKNGSFEQAPDGGPFDWTITSRSGVRSTIAPHPTKPGQSVLAIQFRANRAYEPSVRQTLMLAPGSYQLTGHFSSSLLGPRGLVWRVGCLSGTTLTTTDVMRGATPGWTPFSATFEVPQEDCRVQYLSVALDDSRATERFMSGAIRFDDLSIERNRSAALGQP